MVARLILQHQVLYGSCIYVAHSLNSWSLKGAIKLSWTKNNIWQADINITENFEYKYIQASYHDPETDTIWERGKNRKFLFPKQKTSQTEFWQSRKIQLTLVDKKKEYSKNKCLVMVTGTCGSLESPVRMDQSKINKTSCFTANFIATIDEIQDGIDYQYLIFSENRFGSEITEIISPQKLLSLQPRIQKKNSFKIQRTIC